MSTWVAGEDVDTGGAAAKSKPVRADAQRNTDALFEAAIVVFSTSGVDAPVREIAEKAGVGFGHCLPALSKAIRFDRGRVS